MANFLEAFYPENGINLDDLVGIFAGTNDPSVAGEAAPVGSLYIRNNGQLFQKYGVADTNWMVFAQGLGEATKISSTDTNAGYLNSKLLVSSALTKSTQNTGANETMTLDIASVGTPGTYRSVTTNSKGQVIAGTNPTTLSGYGIIDAQPLDATLTSLSNYAAVGILTMTASDSFVGRTITGTANQISAVNGDGVAGDPTLSFPTTILFPGTTGIRPPSGTTAQRVETASYLRFNTDLSALEYYNGTSWIQLVASTGGTVTSVAVNAPSQGLTISGSPITTSGTFTFALANDLEAVEGLTTTGFAVRTASDSWTTRQISETTDRISISNADGISGNPTIDIASTYVGQTSITTLGLISTGTWQGSVISTQFGGTGRSTIGSANQLLGVNTTGTGLEYKSLSAGTGIGLAFTGGQITVSNTGVTSVTGTTNQVITSGSTGNITLSLPQSIGTTSTPTFSQILVSADPTSPLQLATKQYVDNAVSGIDYKASARFASSANITLSGVQSIDGFTPADGDRILVKNQTSAIENGIYSYNSTGAWSRTTDFDTWTEVPDAFVFIEEGATFADTAWVCTSDAGGTIGTTAISWIQFSSVETLTAGTGLVKSGHTISIVNIGTPGTYNSVTVNSQGQVTAGTLENYLTGNQNITLQGDVSGFGQTLINVTLASVITPDTYQSVTVDSKGRVIAGTNPSTLAGYGITDAQPLNTYLSSVSALNTSGLLVKNGSSAIARTIEVGSTKLSIVNGDGVNGDPTLDVVESNLSLNNIGGTLSVSKGGTGLVSLGTANQLIGVNSADSALEYKTLNAGTGIAINNSGSSITINATNSGTVSSVAISGSTGLSVSGSPITSAGTISLTLGSELQALAGSSALGLITRIGTATYAERSIVSGNGTITITNPAGTSGNIGLDLSAIGTAGTYKSVTTDTFGRVISGTNPTTLSGYGITDAASNSATFITINQESSLTNERYLAGTSDQITITDNGAGSSVAIGIASNPVFTGTSAITIPSGTTANRPSSPTPANVRFNTDIAAMEYFDGSTWQAVGRQAFTDAIFPHGFKNRAESTISYNNSTRTITIAPASSSFTYYFGGTKVIKTSSESVTVSNTDSLWFIYYDSTGTLSASTGGYDLEHQVPVVSACWNSTMGEFITFGDERHGCSMDWATHKYLHTTQGTKYGGGLNLGDYTLTGTGAVLSDAQFSISNGSILDEDLSIAISHSATPTNYGEQVLNPVAYLPIFYRSGTGIKNWFKTTATSTVLKMGTTYPQYNVNTSGTWSLSEIPAEKYFCVTIVATNNIFESIGAAIPQAYYDTLQEVKDIATYENADIGQPPAAEFRILYRLFFKTSASYSNAVKSILVDIDDMRATTITSVTTSTVVEHSSLSGLLNDDHTQYVHNAIDRLITAQHTFTPTTTTAPFALGSNAQGQLVTGLNADLLDGYHASSFQPIDSDLTALANTSTTGLYSITGSGTSVTRTIVAPAAGITISNGSGVSGNPTLALADDLAAVENLSSTGIAVRTSTSNWSTRSLVAGSGISITNADGVAGNITISATGTGVTSVGLSLPSIFTVSGSPITTSGTLTGTLASQSAGTFFVAPLAGGTPTFRTVSIDELSDVVITSPSTNQVIAYNGSSWVNTGAVGANAAGLIGVGQSGAAAWTLLSGTRYYADFAHNLGTTNVVITVFDTATNAVVIPDSTVLTNVNTVRITVVGNTRTLKVVVVANGQSIVAGGSTPTSIITAKDGVTVSTAATKLNFTGQAVGVTDAGSGTTNVTIGSRFTFFANSLDTPVNSDFAINAIAAATADPTYPSLNVRQFSNTTEQGVAFLVSIPAGATTMTLKYRGRAQTAPGAASVVQPRLYSRLIPNNTAVSAWSAAYELANISIPTNAFFQYATQTISLSTIGFTAGNMYQLELTRRVTGVTGTNLAANFLLAELTVEFA